MLGVISIDNITLMVYCVIFTLNFGFLTPNGNSSLVGKAELGVGILPKRNKIRYQATAQPRQYMATPMSTIKAIISS